MPTFISPTTQERVYHRVTYSSYKEGRVIHLDDKRNEIVCKESGLPMILDDERGRAMIEAAKASGYNEFAGMSPERKKAMLQQRSDQDFKKNILPRKEQMNRDIYGNGAL